MSLVTGWPIGVRAISLEDLESLGIDGNGMLHWGGRPMIIEQRLTLTPWQKITAGLIVVCAIAAGFGGLIQILHAITAH